MEGISRTSAEAIMRVAKTAIASSPVSAEPGPRLVELLASRPRRVHPLEVGIELLVGVFIRLVATLFAAFAYPQFNALGASLLLFFLDDVRYQKHDVSSSPVPAEPRRRLVKRLPRVKRRAHPTVVGYDLLVGVFVRLVASLILLFLDDVRCQKHDVSSRFH